MIEWDFPITIRMTTKEWECYWYLEKYLKKIWTWMIDKEVVFLLNKQVFEQKNKNGKGALPRSPLFYGSWILDQFLEW